MRQACPVLFALLLTGCGGGSGSPIDMVVPKGYTGPIWVVLDPDGQDIPRINGRYQVVIPTDGVLRVRSFTPFNRWHEFSARYDDNSALPQEHGVSPAGPNKVALWGGGSAVSQRDGKELRWMPYFVGTAKEYSDWPAMDLPPEAGR